VETNIVIFYLQPHLDEVLFMKDLEEKGIRISNMGNGKMRLVTHLDYTEDQHGFFLETIKAL
jgi:threonine aldolase